MGTAFVSNKSCVTRLISVKFGKDEDSPLLDSFILLGRFSIASVGCYSSFAAVKIHYLFAHNYLFDRVSASSYQLLISMGFPKGASAEALRQTNNDIPNALQARQMISAL